MPLSACHGRRRSEHVAAVIQEDSGTDGPLPGLYFTGHWTRPGGGITPVIISALRVADAIGGDESDLAGWRATAVGGGVG